MVGNYKTCFRQKALDEIQVFRAGTKLMNDSILFQYTLKIVAIRTSLNRQSENCELQIE